MDTDDLVLAVEEAATEVYEALGDGRLESVYEQAMAVELRLRGIPYRTEAYTEVFYKGHRVGAVALDFVVGDKLVVELKATKKIQDGAISQAGAYMRETGLSAGLVITFPSPLQTSPQFERLP